MTAPWDPTTVLRAAADWSWVPPDAESITSDVTLTRWPDWAQGRVTLTRVRSRRSAAQVLREAMEQARHWGSDTLGVRVTMDGVPDLTPELRSRGAHLEDTVEVLARQLGSNYGDDAPEGRTIVRRIENLDGLRDADRVDTVVWDQRPMDDTRLATSTHDLLADTSPEVRVIAYLDGEPVATAGMTLAPAPLAELGTVARLWGAGTLPDRRGRGAYRAVLTERLRLAREAGATLALVKGRVSTSARILRRTGFETYGDENYYRLPL